jgi:hypothetical protein
MKKLLALSIGLLGLTIATSVARADQPAKQEGRVWIDQNFVLAFTPEWSLSTMPGARVEFARTRESKAGVHFLELFFGPNYTRRMGNLTLKASLWYYYMGYPGRDRLVEKAPFDGSVMACSAGVAEDVCKTSTYNFSHNLEIIPSAEYRIGRWSIYDRVIFHNTFYADTYSSPSKSGAGDTINVDDQRWGWGTVLRELIQGRYAVTDRLGVSVADELFFGIIEDGDTSKIADSKGYRPAGYWKSGLRYNRTYFGFDYKVSPNFTIAPMYMVELGLSPTDSGDVTDVAHTMFVVATVVAPLFAPPK